MKYSSVTESDYQIDDRGFLLNHEQWDENFVRRQAPNVGIKGKLSKKHWEVIYYIRRSFEKNGKCPLVYETCRENGLSLASLRSLFPSGYLRGACKLGGLTYREGYVKYSWLEANSSKRINLYKSKIYGVDVRGFLVDSSQWDEDFALHKAYEMKLPGGLSEKHWQVIYSLREYYDENGTVPTVYECCESNQLDYTDCEKLFPDGYHRGAVKIAGLRVM